MIAIIDYEVGNLASVKNMLKKVGCENIITNDKNKIAAADKLILPGVGHFKKGIKNITELGLKPVLDEQVLKKRKPILGICLGMQLLTNHSEEGDVDGLGWVDAKTIKFDPSNWKNTLKIPHMGWSEVRKEKKSNLIDEGEILPRFYFVHSYHVVCNNAQDILGTTEYGIRYHCAIEKNNILGVQFHPEKSHTFGMQLLRNFVEKY